MKLDMDFSRELLILIENEVSPSKPLSTLLIRDEAFGQDEIDYHISRLVQAGYLEAYEMESGEWHIHSLTWDGHLFLNAARDETRWNKAKQQMQEKGGSLTFEVVKTVLAQLAGRAIGSG